MANISQYINAIQNAVYGEEVRSSIINALNKVNDDNESYQAIKNEIIHSKDEVEAVMNVFDSKVNDAKELTKKIQELSNNADSSKVALDEAIKKAEGLELLIDVDNANKVKAELDNAVAKATTTKQELESADSNVQSTIAQATTIKNDLDTVITTINRDLDTVITTATSIKNELNNAVSSGNELKTALTTVVNNATTVKNELQSIVNNVTTVKNELNTLITNANKVKTDLQSEVNKSTTALNDLKKENASAVKNLADLQNGNFNQDELKNDIKANEDDIFLIKLHLGLIGDDYLGIQVDYKTKTYTRLGKAVGLKAGSDFDKFPMYGGRTRCNISDNGIVTESHQDGYVEDGSNGQVMVRQPKFYYKVVPLEIEKNNGFIQLTKANYYISFQHLEGFKLHPAFFNERGKECTYLYIGAYEGSLYDVSDNKYLMNNEQVGDFTPTTGDKLCSIAGVTPMTSITQGLNIDTAETIAKNRGQRWHNMNIKVLSMNQLLMLIEFGTFGVQDDLVNGIGTGVIDTEEFVKTGATAQLMNKSSSANGVSDFTSSISYRGLENPWGNVFELISGVKVKVNEKQIPELFICNDFDYDNSESLSNYTLGCHKLPYTSNGEFIGSFNYDREIDWSFFPSLLARNYIVQDYFIQPSVQTNDLLFLHHGGCRFTYGFGGLFAQSFRRKKDDTDNRALGCRLIYVR